MEIIKLLGNFKKKSSIYENFLKFVVEICPYLVCPEQPKVETIPELGKQKLTFLELNTYQLGRTYKYDKNGMHIVSVENLIEDYLASDDTSNENAICLNLEASIDDIFDR